jgi:hypothetical protein
MDGLDCVRLYLTRCEQEIGIEPLEKGRNIRRRFDGGYAPECSQTECPGDDLDLVKFHCLPRLMESPSHRTTTTIESWIIMHV